MNRYIKIKGHDNWFLVLEANQNEPKHLSNIMQELMLRSEVCALHDSNSKKDFKHRLILLATRNINYEELANIHGTILIRSIGSFMPLCHNEIVAEKFDINFPIEDFGEIVICENDKQAEWKWVKYLENRFPNKKILTINYFDLKNEKEVEEYFNKAEYITFSTTFSSYVWFERLSKFSKGKKIIGFCHIRDNWDRALEINEQIEIVEEL